MSRTPRDDVHGAGRQATCGTTSRRTHEVRSPSGKVFRPASTYWRYQRVETFGTPGRSRLVGARQGNSTRSGVVMKKVGHRPVKNMRKSEQRRPRTVVTTKGSATIGTITKRHPGESLQIGQSPDSLSSFWTSRYSGLATMPSSTSTARTADSAVHPRRAGDYFDTVLQYASKDHLFARVEGRQTEAPCDARRGRAQPAHHEGRPP